MNKRLKSALQVLFSLALGFFLIWFIYKDLTEEDKANVMNSIRETNYWWIGLSALIAILSHVFRAYRWKYPLESLDIRIDMPNRFASVMIGYLANLAFPRLGEVTRCAVLARKHNQPFEKLFGTVIAERVVDAFILLFMILLAVAFQFKILRTFLVEALGPMAEKAQTFVFIGVGVVVGIGAFYVFWRFIQRSTNPFALQIRDKIAGLFDGFATIRRMDGQFGFYLHTALIWISYIAMYVVTFQSLPETQEVPVGGILASFVLGGLSIVVVQGGLGAYPLAIMLILALYGVEESTGYAFGWIVWTAQTAMIIVLGFVSMLALPLLKGTKAESA